MEKSKILRFFLSSTDKVGHKPLFEEIILQANKNNLAGATAYKGIMGYGKSSKINSIKLWEVTEKLPIVVEIVDSEPKISEFIEIIRPIIKQAQKVVS